MPHRWLARAFSIFWMFVGVVFVQAAIGEREGVSKRYVSRVIRLGLLAPKIVEMTAEGAQAPDLTAQSLPTGEKKIAYSWRAQQKACDLAAPA
jgi:hypothetical protein